MATKKKKTHEFAMPAESPEGRCESFVSSLGRLGDRLESIERLAFGINEVLARDLPPQDGCGGDDCAGMTRCVREELTHLHDLAVNAEGSLLNTLHFLTGKNSV